MIRFGRDYELIITLTSGQAIVIKPEIRIQFEVLKSVRGGLNKCTIFIFNLNENNRRLLVKDKEEGTKHLPFLFKIGYGDLQTLFKGTIFEALSVRNGSDYITTITSIDGGFDFLNSYTSKTVRDNDVSHIVSDMPNTKLGKVTKRKDILRPRVLVGSSAKLIEDNLEDDETMFIDNETLNIIKDDEVIEDVIPIVDGDTGLLNTPVRKNLEVTFITLMNPSLKIGRLVNIQSISAKHLNGVYKIVTIKYKGDNYGKDWSQECTCMSINNYKVL